MKIFRSLSELTQGFGPVVATIGNFDGVHCGHRWVIGQVNQRARTLGLPSLALTFDPHPVRVLRPELPHSLITPLPQKLELLASTGLDAVLVLPFDAELSRLSAEDFTRLVLCEALHVREVHEGENFRFGYGAAVDIHGLARLGCSLEPSLCFTTRAYGPLISRGAPVSSSRVRALISAARSPLLAPCWGDLSRSQARLPRVEVMAPGTPFLPSTWRRIQSCCPATVSTSRLSGSVTTSSME